MWRRPIKPPAPSKKQRAAAAVFVASIFAAAVLILHRSRGTPVGDPLLPQLRWDSFPADVRLDPSTAHRNGTDAIWQIPTSPRAVLFIAHGCGGRAANFWDRSPACPACVGLPEERLVVLHALRRRFAVLAVSSLGRCWSFGKELGNVKGVIDGWVAAHGLGKLPLVALGASSGGYFVSALAVKVRFSSVALMIAEGVFDEMDASLVDGYPPTLFVHMPKDRARARMVRANMGALARRGVEVKEIECMEFPITADFLSARIPGLNRSSSILVFEFLRRGGAVDEKGFLRKDGRATPWRRAFEDKEHPALEWAPHIQEVLNLAYAYHEMTSLQMPEILEWFESHMNSKNSR